MKRLVLLGAGHAHLIALRQFARHPLPGTEVTLITPDRWQYYSGMIPGCIAGHYGIEQCRIDVAALIAAAGGQLVLDSAFSLSPQQRQVELTSGGSVGYDLLSIDIGSQVDTQLFSDYSGQRLSIRPIDRFLQDWNQLYASAEKGRSPRLAVVGGGAAGVELALATARTFDRSPLSLITGDGGLLDGFSGRVRRLAELELARQGVALVSGRATAVNGSLQLADGRRLKTDAVIIASGARPADFVKRSGLVLNPQGFIAVDEYHRSLSHPHVFAVGDTCGRVDGALNRSGVHAVRAGPLLAANLRASLAGHAMTPFHPRRHSLYLLSCANQTAICSYGPLAFSGAWVWTLKDWIDRRFIAGFERG